MNLPESHIHSFPQTPTPIPDQQRNTSRVIRAGLLTTDITQNFTGAALKLPSGRVVKDEAFTLFEAVSAIEIGDAKMDSGHLEEGETLEDDYDVAQPLSPEQVIWMMDELFFHEVAWHMGYPLSQTLFTSLHINALLWPEPKTLVNSRFAAEKGPSAEDPLLHLTFRSYCLALIKACDLVRDTVLGQHFYEEEDLTSHIFHRELLHHISSDDIQATLDSALSWLQGADMQEKHRVALQHRLRSRSQSLIIFKIASDPARLPECESSTCLALLDQIKCSASLGSSVREAFSLKIQRTLASSVPPRPMIRIKSDHAFAFMTQLFVDLSHVHELLTLDHPASLLPGYWTYMSHTPPHSVYIRAVTQSIIGHQDDLPGHSSLKEFVFKDLRRLVLPGSTILDPAFEHVELPSDQRFQIARQLDDFVFKCGQSYLNIYRTYCLNRCRIRRTLCHAVLEWDQIQADAEEFDASLQLLTEEHPQSYPLGEPLTYSYPLSSWIYHHKLNQMETIILMGFELSIYAPDEIPKMYWHLSQILAVHISHLDRMSHFADQIHEPAATSHQDTQDTQDEVATTEREACLRELFREYSRLKAIEALALALHLVFVFLLRTGSVRRSPRQYNDDQLRYELRMRPFLNISVPEPMPFKEYQEAAVLPQLADMDILDRASRQCSLAKRAWEEILKTHQIRPMFPAAETLTSEWIKDVKDTIRACIATNITISTLKKKADRPSPVERAEVLETLKVSLPAFGESGRWHRWWMVPKIE